MKAEMTPRERVRAALDHQEPDRVPIDLGQANADGITATAYRRLLAHLGLGDRLFQLKDRRGQIARVDEDVLRRFRVDFRSVDLGPTERWTDQPFGDDGYLDEWGVGRIRPEGSYYYDLQGVTGCPFAEDATLSALERHRWPDPEDPGRYRGLRERARMLREETDYAVILNMNCGFFANAMQMRGWENFFADTVVNVAFVEALMDRILDVRLEIARRVLAEAGEYVDVVFAAADDLGMIDRTLISPAAYRALVKERQRRMFGFLKARTPAKMFYHCDGAVHALIPDMIEIGVDALNPVQVSAAGMGDTGQLKAEFGDRLTFWGAVDTHRVLPYGTPAEVREEVRRRIQDLAPGGGYVLGAVHNIQPEVPPENVVALFDAAYELGRYPVDTR